MPVPLAVSARATVIECDAAFTARTPIDHAHILPRRGDKRGDNCQITGHTCMHRHGQLSQLEGSTKQHDGRLED